MKGKIGLYNNEHKNSLEYKNTKFYLNNKTNYNKAADNTKMSHKACRNAFEFLLLLIKLEMDFYKQIHHEVNLLKNNYKKTTRICNND